MRLGDIVVGDFPTRYGSMQVFPNSNQLLQGVPPGADDEAGWWPQSIGQDAGRSNMRGPLPGRYYGADWLAPNSGYVPSVAAVLPAGNGAGDGPPASSTMDASAPLGPISIVTPFPSITYPRRSQQTVPDVCPVAAWVSRNPLLAIGAAVLVYLGVSGGRK